MIRSAGKTLPVVNLTDRGYLTVLLGPQQPFTLHVHFFRNVKVDHPMAIDESDDDMFAPSKRTKEQSAIKEVLDKYYDHYQELYDQANPDSSEEWYIKLGEYLSDYDYLRGELARGGIKTFINGLDMVSRDVIDTIDGALAVTHKVYLTDLEDQYLPLDEDTDEYDDDVFSDNRVVVNPRTLSTITGQIARRYYKYASTSTEPDTAELYRSEAYVLERASDAFLNGLRAGIKELEDLEDSTTWEDLDELAADFNIDLSALMDKYDEGGITESDDAMFSSSTKLDKLKRMPTDTLMMLWNAIKDDDRPEYAEAHRQQKIRLGLALAGRGIYVPYPMGGAPVNLDEDINIPLGSQKGK
jgi:hypothetical protein